MKVDTKPFDERLEANKTFQEAIHTMKTKTESNGGFARRGGSLNHELIALKVDEINDGAGGGTFFGEFRRKVWDSAIYNGPDSRIRQSFSSPDMKYLAASLAWILEFYKKPRIKKRMLAVYAIVTSSL